ncbi:MAG: RNA polymerase sigma factor [Caldilineaceae bacterium]|jgi:RNA polymerase sigma-70 factor (ECF subfamily)
MADIQRGEPIEEATLVAYLQRAQQESDPDAFDGLYLLFADRVYRYLLARLGDAEMAEEVTSQVFLRLIEKVHMYRISQSDNVAIFSAWLYRMAYNKMVDILRARRRANLVDLEHAERLYADGSADNIHDRIDNESIFSKLQLLNEQQREVLILRFIEELSITETAETMQKSEGAIKALQHRALASLRRYLQVQT